jgi:hypothetical protein
MAWLSFAWKVGPWIATALAIMFALYERSGWSGEEAARAADLVAAQQAARKAQIADATHTREIEDAHAAEIIFLKEHANVREASIAAAPSTAVCAGSPAMRTLFDGLRARSGASGAGQPHDAGGTGAAVSR